MTISLTMPKLSPTMTEGVLARWHKKEGDLVKPDDLLFEVSTDKATVEYNALDGGYLRKILIKEGEKASVGDALALMTNTKDEPLKEAAAPKVEKPAPVVPEKKIEAPKIEVPKTAPSPKQAPAQIQQQASTTASPYAKKLAEQKGVSLEGLIGTGPSGRIMSRDLEQAQTRTESTPAPRTQAKPTEHTMSPMRKVIAERLQYSKSTIPHFYIHQLVDATSLIHLREQLKASGFAITVNDLIVKATAQTLKNHPNLRTTFDDTKNVILKHPHADICVAVTIEGGLITPIVANAELKSLTALSKEIRELAEKARTGKLKPEEYMGGCFTISNLGMFGTTDFMAIVNPPQCAILAVGAAAPHAFVKNGAVVAGQALNLTLSCDHRVVDGSDAAKFMKELKDALENPFKMLVD